MHKGMVAEECLNLVKDVCLSRVFSYASVYLQKDFNEAPILFASIQQGCGDVGDNFNRPRVVIKSYVKNSSVLLEEGQEEEAYGTESMNDVGDDDRPAPGTSPFSMSKEVLHGAEGCEGEDQEGFHSTYVVSYFFIVTVNRLLQTLSVCLSVCASVPILWLISRLLRVGFGSNLVKMLKLESD